MAAGMPPTTAMTTEHDVASKPPARIALAKMRRGGRALRESMALRRLSNAAGGDIMCSGPLVLAAAAGVFGCRRGGGGWEEKWRWLHLALELELDDPAAKENTALRRAAKQGLNAESIGLEHGTCRCNARVVEAAAIAACSALIRGVRQRVWGR